MLSLQGSMAGNTVAPQRGGDELNDLVLGPRCKHNIVNHVQQIHTIHRSYMILCDMQYMNVVSSRWRKAGIERESWRFEVYNSAIASCGSAQWQVALALMEDCLFVSKMKCIGCVFVDISKMYPLQNAVACFWRIWFLLKLSSNINCRRFTLHGTDRTLSTVAYVPTPSLVARGLWELSLKFLISNGLRCQFGQGSLVAACEAGRPWIPNM